MMCGYAPQICTMRRSCALARGTSSQPPSSHVTTEQPNSHNPNTFNFWPSLISEEKISSKARAENKQARLRLPIRNEEAAATYLMHDLKLAVH